MTGRPVGVISDELSLDIATAAELAQDAGVSRLEIRSLRTGRVASTVPDEIDEVIRFTREHGIEITTISPGLCKQPAGTGSSIGALVEVNRGLLRRGIDVAHRLGATRIISFGFRVPKDGTGLGRLPGQLADLVCELGQQARSEGVELLIENHSSCYVATTRDICHLVNAPGGEVLGVNWDPYNAWFAGAPVTGAELAAVLPRLRQVHVKDGRRLGTAVQRLAVGTGDIGWAKIIDGSGDVPLVLEPHRRPRIASFREDLLGLRAMTGSAVAA
jgi:sugar phosphate isomerase/epimerase